MVSAAGGGERAVCSRGRREGCLQPGEERGLCVLLGLGVSKLLRISTAIPAAANCIISYDCFSLPQMLWTVHYWTLAFSFECRKCVCLRIVTSCIDCLTLCVCVCEFLSTHYVCVCVCRECSEIVLFEA